MSFKEVRNAIQKQFLIDWADQTEVALQNQDYKPDDDRNSWVRFSASPIDGTQITLGGAPNRRFRKFGVVAIQVFTSLNDATDNNDILSDNAVNIFEGKTFDNIVFRDTRIVEVGASEDWYQQNVLSDFYYDEYK